MQHAIDLSLKGAGRVNPNPMVGAVLVKDGQIIGEGYHAFFGGPHAEVNAISSAGEGVEGACLYVTLEPCNHHGKTPPCTELIIREKIARVVVGMKDPNPHVSGQGIRTLQSAGISVSEGILEPQCLKVNEVFSKFIHHKTPFVAIKTAMTLDGKIATHTGDSRWITNERSRQQVHELRHRYAAIMVGVGTVLADDPELTDRSGHATKSHPLRIVMDSHGRTPLNSKILDTSQAATLVAVTAKAPGAFIRDLQAKGVECLVSPEKNGKVDLRYVVSILGERGIDSILIEGGSRLNFSALAEGVADKVYSFIAPKMVGGDHAPAPVGGEGVEKISEAVSLKIESVLAFDDDLLIEAYIKK